MSHGHKVVAKTTSTELLYITFWGQNNTMLIYKNV